MASVLRAHAVQARRIIIIMVSLYEYEIVTRVHQPVKECATAYCVRPARNMPSKSGRRVQQLAAAFRFEDH